jgi:hypothetical protein
MKNEKKNYASPKLVQLGSIGQVTQIALDGSGGLGGGNTNAHGGNPNANDHASK